MTEMVQKQWGWSTVEVSGPHCEVHRIDVRRGGHCSWHKHMMKDNVFSVANGRLLIEYHDHLGDIEQELLQPGDTFVVEAGVIHRFHAPLEPVRAFEVYYPAGVSALLPDDIIRFSEGGIQ